MMTEMTRLKSEITITIIVKWLNTASRSSWSGVMEIIKVTKIKKITACQNPCLELSKSAELKSKPPIQIFAATTRKMTIGSQLKVGIMKLTWLKDC